MKPFTAETSIVTKRYNELFIAKANSVDILNVPKEVREGSRSLTSRYDIEMGYMNLFNSMCRDKVDSLINVNHTFSSGSAEA